LAGGAGDGNANWGFGHGAAPVGNDELEKKPEIDSFCAELAYWRWVKQ
jgi:hypothetical protein